MIAEERIDQIMTIVERAGISAQTITALRDAFSDLHFTLCMDDDIGEYEPVRSLPGVNLYLVDGGSGHCMQLTRDADSATGVVLAEREP